MSDLVERLRALVILDEVGSNNPLGRDAAAEIERLQRELATMELRYQAQVGTALEHLRGKQDAQTMLADARRYAFFVGWEMCETAGAEDTCADAFAFWSLMEDGRDEVEGRK